MRKRRLDIVTPCTTSWSDMAGTNMVRHCMSCSKDVYNLSMLTEREAEAALSVRPDEVCVIYFVDRSGQVVFYPEARVPRAPRRMLAAALTASTLAACSRPAPNEIEAPPVAIESNHVSTNHDGPTAAARTPVAVAPTQAPPTPSATEDEACGSEWEQSFDKRNRNDAHTREHVEKAGGIRSHDPEDTRQDGLMPAPRRRPERETPGPRHLPSRDEVVAAFTAVAGAVASCEGPGVAFANTEFAGDTGRVINVAVTGVPPETAACVEDAVRQARVPKFTSTSLKLKYPFRLKD